MTLSSDYLHRAEDALKIATHMFEVTYPLVSDQKLLLAVLEHLASAFEQGVLAAVHTEHAAGRVRILNPSFALAYHTFKMHAMAKYGVTSQLTLFDELSRILTLHKESEVEFVRHDALVLCADSFSEMRTLDVVEVKKYLRSCQQFLASVRLHMEVERV